MKFTSILAIAFCVVAVSAAPRRGGNRHNKVNNSNKVGTQVIDNGGNTSSGGGKGLLGDVNILGGGIGNKETTNNKNSQNLVIN
jgi:hypothetical protein